MPREGSARERVARAEEILKANIGDPRLSPSVLARKLNVDLPTFSRAFKQLTGKTCTHYIATERIRIAKDLLVSDGGLVKEIASRVGFRNPNYFTRRFRAMEGLSPTTYRRQRRGNS
ncbi:MAG TPA: AraC family transcriptional regulator [bacterium]|nr:AraC family transcriptional regulator [bacterium]